MSLNKAVVNAIHRFLDSPDPDTLHKMTTTGSIFRYLQHQDQLGVHACNQLFKHLGEHLKTLDHKTLMNLYKVLDRGFIGGKAFSTLVTKSMGESLLNKKPSIRTTCY